jgi:hypothetical protein
MNIALDASTLSLGQDGLIAVRDGCGSRVRCLSGSLWITEDHSASDTIVGPGETFTLRRDGLTLIMALHPATLQVSERHQSLAHRIGEWLWRLLPRRLVAPPGYC